MSLEQKFREQELTPADVLEWVNDQSEAERLEPREDTADEDEHVATCLYHIFLWYHGTLRVEHFLQAVLRNDFTQACGRADSTNKKVLSLYAKFLYNFAPGDWQRKAQEQFGKSE